MFEKGNNMGDERSKSDGGADKTAAEDRIIEASEHTMHEMRDAMTTMMGASTQMMQSFLDMRLSYLKVMRASLDDPQATVDMMSKNIRDVADAVNKNQREE